MIAMGERLAVMGEGLYVMVRGDGRGRGSNE